MGLKDVTFSLVDVLVLFAMLLWPPLVISSAITCVLFFKRGIIRTHPITTIIILFVTAFASFALLIVVQNLLPKSLRLGKGIFFVGGWPIYPLSFIIVAVVATAIVWFSYRSFLSQS